MVKYGRLMLSGAVPGKRASDINFTNEVVPQCDVSVLKKLLLVIAL